MISIETINIIIKGLQIFFIFGVPIIMLVYLIKINKKLKEILKIAMREEE